MQESRAELIDSILSQIEIASPCSQSWDGMAGDDCKRYCEACKFDVFDLSKMSKNEIAELLLSAQQSGDRTCVRFFRRFDGKVMTRDCPVGVRMLQTTRENFRKAHQIATAAFTVCFALLTGKLAFQHSCEALDIAFRQIESQIRNAHQLGNCVINSTELRK